MNAELVAKQIVRALLTDLCNRSGLDNAWDSIDDDIRKEIKEEWVEIVRDKITEAA